jgi:AcrR family transcriptional regulator
MTVGRPRSAAVDAAILDAALGLFAEGGIAAVSFEQVARRASVSRATVYRRWSSREELIAFSLAGLRERAEAPLGDWERRSLDEMLDWLIEVAPRAMRDPFQRRLMAQALAMGPGAARLRAIYWDAVVKPREALFLRLIAQAQVEGRVSATASPALIQDMMAGALLQRMLFDEAESNEADLRAYLSSLLVAVGLRAAPSTTRQKEE